MNQATNSLEHSVPPQPLTPGQIRDLVKKAQDGDEIAFNQLYKHFYPIVHRRVWQMVPVSEVDDITQEVFLSAIRSLKNFRGESKFSTWLYTLTTRQVANYYRKQERTPQQTENDFEEYANTLASTGGDHNEKYINEFIVIRNGLAQLSPDYQNILLLRLVEGYKFREIGEIIGKSLDATKSLFRRALMALQQEVKSK